MAHTKNQMMNSVMMAVSGIRNKKVREDIISGKCFACTYVGKAGEYYFAADYTIGMIDDPDEFFEYARALWNDFSYGEWHDI